MLAEPQLQRSEVVAVGETGAVGSQLSDIRTSSGMFLERGQDTVIKGEIMLWAAGSGCWNHGPRPVVWVYMGSNLLF
jgi:hypothetical protein